LKEVEQARELAKALHAEPLYIDLIRGLGARKGEREWNVGLTYDSYELLAEYKCPPSTAWA
jgi:hypothetical protein